MTMERRSDRPRIVSFGAGVNSTAVLVGLRERGETPDAIVFADTGGERPATYEHLEVMQRWCDSVKMPRIQVVKYDSYHGTLEQECIDNETLPSKAFGYGGCSVKWKRRPIDKWVEANFPGQQVNRLIGIHFGEKKRGQIPDTSLYHFVYPLREWRWSQPECEDACMREFGYIPPKSSCFFCPAMKIHEILHQAEHEPDLFARSLAIEDNAIEAGNLETTKGLGRAWSWRQLVENHRKFGTTKLFDAGQRLLFPEIAMPSCHECNDEGDQ